MIGILLVGHGKLATEFRASLQYIIGHAEQVGALDILPDDNVETKRDHIVAQLTDLDEGDGVIILTDMFGGTPSNLAISTLGQDSKIEVIAGMNLPMIIKLMEIRDSLPFNEAVLAAQEAGKKYIHAAGQLLNG